MAAVCWTSVMPFTPVYLGEMGVATNVEFWAGLIGAVGSAGTMVMAPVWGAIGDRFGRRLGMLRAAIFLMMGYALMALVETPLELLLVRLIIGVLTGFVPMAVALIGVSTPREQIGPALGLVQTAWPAGNLLGPMLGGAIADWLGLRAAMWASAVILGTISLCVYLLVREQFTPPPKEQNRMFRDLQHAASYPVLIPIILVSSVSMASFGVLDPVLVPFVKGLLGADSPSWLAGFLYSVPGVAFVLTAPWWARRGERIGFHKTVAAGLLVSGLLYLPTTFVTGPWQFGLLRVAIGVAGAAIGPGVATMLATAVPRELRGRAFGLNQSAASAGAVVGPLMGGAVASFLGQRGVFILTAGILLAGYLWVTRVLTPRLLDARASGD